MAKGFGKFGKFIFDVGENLNFRCCHSGLNLKAAKIHRKSTIELKRGKACGKIYRKNTI